MRPDSYERQVSFKVPLIGAAIAGGAGTVWIGPGLGMAAAFIVFLVLLAGAVLFTPPSSQ
jgi:hypothetical protein